MTTIFTGLMAEAQNNSADKQAIEKQVDAMISSWNKHDYSDMKSYTTTDCDWVNIVGMWWKNQKEVAFAHRAFHEKMFKNTSLTKKSVSIRLIRDDVALVHYYTRVGTFTTPNGHVMPEADNLALLVYVKNNGKWLLTSGENLVVDEHAQASNPVNFMPK